jgi:predicted RNA-binding protein with EMAP domain
MVVQKKYIEEAWRILKKCLIYTKEIIEFVDMGKTLAKAREYIRRFNGEVVWHSDALRMTNSGSKDFDASIQTLIERDEIEKDSIVVTRKNGTHTLKWFYRWKVVGEKG